MPINRDILYFYRHFRQHQMETYGYSLINEFGSDRWEKAFSGGGAAPGFHAVAAYNSARSQIHFRKTLTAK